nr:hypothetical protein [candidate division KSB1 bacterium]
MKNSTKLKPNISLFVFYTILIVVIIGNAVINHQNRQAYEAVFIVLYVIAGLMALISW